MVMGPGDLFGPAGRDTHHQFPWLKWNGTKVSGIGHYKTNSFTLFGLGTQVATSLLVMVVGDSLTVASCE